MDIHLPKISGIDFLKTISNPPPVILTTAFADYALEGYELNVVDYLLKPFSFQRFVQAVSKVPVKDPIPPNPKAADQHQQARRELFIKSGYEHIKVRIDDILYIKSDADYTEIFTQEKKFLSSEPLRYWLEHLPDYQFARVHKSYIVNTAEIEKISGNRIYLNKDMVIPIGRSYKDTFIKRVVK